MNYLSKLRQDFPELKDVPDRTLIENLDRFEPSIFAGLSFDEKAELAIQDNWLAADMGRSAWAGVKRVGGNIVRGVEQTLGTGNSTSDSIYASADRTVERIDPLDRLRTQTVGFQEDSENSLVGLTHAAVGSAGSMAYLAPTALLGPLAPLGASGLGGLMLGGGSAKETEDQLKQIPDEQLAQAPAFQSYLARAEKYASEVDDVFALARAQFEKDLIDRNFRDMTTVGGVSMGVLGPLAGKVIRGGTGAISGAGKGFATESAQEFFESGTESYAGQRAIAEATGGEIDQEVVLRDALFGAALGGATGGVIGAGTGALMPTPVASAEATVEEAGRIVAEQGGDALSQEAAKAQVHSRVMPSAVIAEQNTQPTPDYSALDIPSVNRERNVTRGYDGLDGLITLADRMGFTDEVAQLTTAKRLFQQADQSRSDGKDDLASMYVRRGNDLYRRATETNDTIREQAANFPVPYVFDGQVDGGQLAPLTQSTQTSNVFDQQPDPAQLNGTRGLLNDAGVIYGQEPSEVTTARQQRQADNFSAFYGQEGTAQFRSDAVTGELDRSSELPPAPERSALPPGTGQIDLGRDRSKRTFTPISSEYPGVGRNVIERQSQAAPALPQGNTARSITQAQMIDLQDQYRQAIRVPVRDRTPEQKQAVETINAVRSGDIAVVESPPATSSVVDTEAAVEAPQMPLRPLTAEDAQVDSFDLTGSNRTADTEAAQGQGDLLGIWQSKPDLNTNPDTAAVSKRLPDRYNLVLQEKGPFKGGWRVIGPDGFMGAIRKDQVEAVNWAIDQISKIEEGKKNAAAEKQAQESLAEKIKKGDKPSSRDWQNAGLADAYQLNRGYVYQSDISQFLVKHFGIPKNNIRNNIGKASGVVRSDMGNETPIVYLGRLHEVFRQSEQRSSKAKQTQQPLQIEQHAEQPATQQAELTNAPEPTEPAVIEDVGEKLGRARKDELRTARERLGNMDDEQIASTTLSKLWPKSELDKIEDPVSAAIYHTARNMVPNKPRIGYKLKRWVDQVKQARDLLNMVDEIGSDKFIQAIRDKGIYSLQSFADKVELLTGVDRSHWDRIGRVEKASGAYREGEEMVSGSWMLVEIDKRMTIHRGASEVSEIISPVNAHLEKSANEQPVMKFEIRHDRRHTVYQINKTGDNEQRPLKTFDTLKEARDYLRNNNADLVEAWEAVKQRDNVTKADMRSDNNRDRTGQDYRGGKDVSAEEFIETFGFRGAEFGNWVKQGKAGQERQGLLNDAYDAFMDLANVLGLPPKALSFEGRLGIGFGSRGRGGRNAAHYEPDLTIISLTKTKGAGSLAHEWFHALDNYFSRKRGDTEFNGDQKAYREGAFVTYRPEPMMAYKPSMKGGRAPYLITKAEYNRRKERGMGFEESRWIADPDHPKGIRPEVEKEFAELVNTLNASPMLTRSQVIDKGKVDGYWSQIIERAARSFETHIIAKLAQKGYRNDFLANVTSFEKFKRDPGRYPYLKPDEQGPVSEAFDKLFSTIETKETESGVAMFSRTENVGLAISRDQVEAIATRITADWSNAPEMITVASDLDLPVDLQGYIDAQNARGEIDGVFHKGKFYLVADKIRTEADVERIVLHEALGHYGLRQLYGPALGMHMDRLFNRVGGYKGIQRLGKKYGFDLSSYWENPGDMSIAQRREMMADELVAHIAGTGTIQPDLIQRIAHLIREGLRKMMAGTRFADRLNQMTDVEVLRIVAAARQAVTKGESRITMLTHDPRFVREFEKVVYGEKWVKNGDLLYLDQEKSPAFSERSGLRLPKDVRQLRGYPQTVVTESELVKYREENPDTRFSRVPDDAPVIETDGGPIAKGRTLNEMSSRALLYAQKFANKVVHNQDHGDDIIISKKGIKHTLRGAQEDLIKTVAVTPEILERGIFLGSEPDKRGNPDIIASHFYGVKVSVDGRVHDIVAVVKEHNDGKRYYDHSIERKKEEGALTGKSNVPRAPSTEANDTASNLSIASESESSTVAVPLSNEDLRAGIRAILPDFKDGDNRATIVNSFSGLPDVVKQEAKNQGSNGDDVEGVFHNGTIYVVADKITSVGQLETLLFHEGTHGGVNALYADEGVSRAMNRLYAAMGGSTGFNKVVDQLEIRNKIEPYIKGTLQREADGRVAMPRELRNTILMQEVLAYTGEKGSKSFQLRLRELVGAVRNWLREHGFLNLAELGVTDIAYMAKQAREQGLKQSSDGGVTLFRFGDSVRNAFRPTEQESTQGGFGIPTERMTDVIVRKFQDKFKVLRDVQASIRKQGRTIAEDADAYMAEELFHGKTKEDLDVITDTMVKPFAQLLSKHKIDQADIDLYLMAKHAEERNAHIASINPDMPDGGSGLTNAQARQILSDVAASGKQAQYDEIAQVVYDMLANRRTILTESGLLDQSEVDAWESKYQHYVPLKGWAANETQDGRPRTGKGLSIGGKETKRALGRTSQAASPSTYAIHDLTESIVRKRKNEVGNAFLNLVEQNPSKDYWQVFTDDNPETSRTIRKRQDENGNTVEEVVEQAIPMAMMSDRYFTTKKYGKTYYIKLEDQRLLNAMNNVGPEASNALTRTMGAVTRFMSAMNTSYNPEFVVGNFARDVQTAILNLTAEQSRAGGKVEGEQIAAKTVKDIPKAMRAVYRGLRGKKATNPEWQQWYDEFRKAGAQTGYYDMKDIDGQMKDVERLVQIADGGFIGGFHKWRKAGAKLVEDMNGAVENAVRLSAYVNARKAGISQAQAASLAKNMTVNFNRRGEMGTMMNSLYMFFNASVQGISNFGRTMFGLKGNREDPVWKRLTTAQKLAVGIAMGAYALAYANRMAAGEDDDGVNWYDKVPDYVRERNLVFMKSVFGGPQDGSYWKIPLPYGYNIFAIFGENIQAFLSGNRSIGKTSTELAMGVMGSFNPIGFVDSNSLTAGVLRNITPSIGKPIADLVANENFMGTSIYNENFPFGTPKPESQLSRRSTPASYKAIAEWLNEVSGGSKWRSGHIDINPDAMRYMVDYFTGGAGAFFTNKAPDYATRLATGVEVEPHRVPFLSRINGRVMPYEDQSQFYNRRDEINQVNEEFKALTGRERIEFYRDNQDKLALRPMIRTTENQLKALRGRRDAIQANESYSAKERDQRLKEIEALMKASVDRFNRQYNAL